MMLFVLTSACATRTKCHICRDPGAIGKQFREAHAVSHEMPGEGLFECPNGITLENIPTKPLAYSPAPTHGPGTELKKLLAEYGLIETPSCSCKSLAAEMDRMGVAGCRENISMIVDRLREELVRRGATAWDLKFFDDGIGESVVREAINNVKSA